MSTPPNMPPGGGQPPYTQYDPKTQWRVYREQQKVAWRAQRDAMPAFSLRRMHHRFEFAGNVDNGF